MTNENFDFEYTNKAIYLLTTTTMYLMFIFATHLLLNDHFKALRSFLQPISFHSSFKFVIYLMRGPSKKFTLSVCMPLYGNRSLLHWIFCVYSRKGGKVHVLVTTIFRIGQTLNQHTSAQSY